jgi:hypothetical protein
MEKMMAVDIQPNAAAPAPDPATPDVSGTPAGMPTNATSTIGSPQQPNQPSAPPKETVGQGFVRGAKGTQYVSDAQGGMTEARFTAPSAKGTFGSILAGVTLGAIAGASRARVSGIPNAEARGGFGEGVGAAVQDATARDERNRAHADQDFAAKQSAQKVSREQLESQASIAHLNADSERIRQATKFADDEQPLIVAGLKQGLTEQTQRIQKMSQDLQTGMLGMTETLAKYGIDASKVLTTWSGAKQHAGEIGSGKTAALYNGVPMGEEGHGSGLHDPLQLKTTPLMKPETFSTWSTNAKGEPIESVKTLPAGTSALDYVSAKMNGFMQLEKIHSEQKIQLAVDETRARTKEANASAFKSVAEGKKAEAETVGLKEGIQGQAEDLVESNMDPSQIQKRGNQYTPILNAAREYSMKKYEVPFDLAKAQEDYKFASDSRTQNRLKYMNSLVGDERTGTAGNLDLLIQYSNKVNRTDFPALNNVAAWAKLESGNTDIIKLHNAAVDAADQFANIMSGGGSGSATSDAKIKQGMDMFSQKFSKDQMKASASSVKDMLNNRKREFIGDNRYLRKQYLPPEKQNQQTGTQPQQTTGAPGGAPIVKGAVISNGKDNFMYNGVGDPADIKNYTKVNQ